MDCSFQTRRTPISDDAKYVMESMVYGYVKYFKGWMSTTNGMLSRRRNFVSVAWVMIIILKIAKEEENVEYQIVTRSITNCYISRRRMIQKKVVEMEQVDKMAIIQTRCKNEMDQMIKHCQQYQKVIHKWH